MEKEVDHYILHLLVHHLENYPPPQRKAVIVTIVPFIRQMVEEVVAHCPKIVEREEIYP